jgi:hypothetical protein
MTGTAVHVDPLTPRTSTGSNPAAHGRRGVERLVRAHYRPSSRESDRGTETGSGRRPSPRTVMHWLPTDRHWRPTVGTLSASTRQRSDTDSPSLTSASAYPGRMATLAPSRAALVTTSYRWNKNPKSMIPNITSRSVGRRTRTRPARRRAHTPRGFAFLSQPQRHQRSREDRHRIGEPRTRLCSSVISGSGLTPFSRQYASITPTFPTA